MLREYWRALAVIFLYHTLHHACLLPHWQVNEFLKWSESVLFWSVAGLQVGTWCGSSSCPSLSSYESWSGTRARHRPKRNPLNRRANAAPLRRPAIEPNPHAKELLFQAALHKFQESTIKLLKLKNEPLRTHLPLLGLAKNNKGEKDAKQNYIA